MNENRRDDTALSNPATASSRPAESGSGESAGAVLRESKTRIDAAIDAAFAHTQYDPETCEEDPNSISVTGRLAGLMQARAIIIAAERNVDARESGAESRSAPSIRPASAENDAADDGGKPSPLSRT